MVRKMKWKFIGSVMGSIVVLLIIVWGSMYLTQQIQMTDRYDQLLSLVLENNGEFSKSFDVNKTVQDSDRRIWQYALKVTKETPYENRYFLVHLSDEGEVEEVNIEHISSVDEASARKMAQDVLSGEVKELLTEITDDMDRVGTYNTFRYRLAKDVDGTGYVIGFADMYQQIQNNLYIQGLTGALAIVIFLILFLIVLLSAKRVLEPLILNMEKQKQFITDAGHELKTPLAVISADVDVIELTEGKSEWTESIRKQTVQMSELIKRLLYLSKMEENVQFVMNNLNLSKLVDEVVDRVSPIAVSQNKSFKKEIEKDIVIKGDAGALEQLISVLSENAVKYCKEEGEIEIKLYKDGKTACLEMRNSGDPIDEKIMPRLFDRFYRPDSDRNKKTGGFGIGLSVAKAIVLAHKGKICAQNEKKEGKDIVAFCVELSMRGTGGK